MNIFVLSEDPVRAGIEHCDKHVVKMIIEYAQLLSAAHRILDGQSIRLLKPSGKPQVLLALSGETWSLDVQRERYIIDNPVLYNVSHSNHPSAVWARSTAANYNWLVALFASCLSEYQTRYSREHKTGALFPHLKVAPRKIPRGPLEPFALAMPEQYKVDDAVLSYQNYYVGDKTRFARWTNTPVPKWFADRQELDVSNFTRTR